MLPFNRNTGLIIVPVRLQVPSRDVVVRFALDTGATGSSINRDIAILLGYDPDNLTDLTRLITASGHEQAPAVVFAEN